MYKVNLGEMLAGNHHYYNYHLDPTAPIQSPALSVAFVRSPVKFSVKAHIYRALTTV